MLKIKDKKYDFDFEVFLNNGEKLEGKTNNNNIPIYDFFLENRITYFIDENGEKSALWFNKDAINFIKITNIKEK